MNDNYPLPIYDKILAEYLNELRCLIFGSQREAGEYFDLNRSTIARYENNFNPIKPPQTGYFVCLLKLAIEKIEKEAPEHEREFIENIQKQAIAEANKVIGRYYPRERKIRTWDELCELAEAYRSKYRKMKLPVQKELQPYYIPVRDPGFIGRKEYFDRIFEKLNSRWPIVEIVGMVGIGKTDLAIEVFHFCLTPHGAKLTDPFQAIVWVSARNRPQQHSWLETVLDRVAQELPAEYVLEQSFEKKQATITQLLQVHRTLIILDNFETMAKDLELEKWLNDLAGPSQVLITSRRKHMQNAGVIYLEGLPDAEVVELIHTLANNQGSKDSQTTNNRYLLKLIEFTEGHPYVIRAVVGLMSDGFPLETIVNQMVQGKKAGREIIDYIVEKPWQALANDNDARNLLRVVPFFTRRITRDALAKVSGLADDCFDQALTRLVRLFLLKVEGGLYETHYSVHPIVRTFVSTQPPSDLTWETQARQRWVTYYLNFLEDRIRRKEIEEPYWRYLGGGKLKSIGPEWPNLLNTLEWADQQQQDEVLIELMLRLVHYMDRRAYHPIRLDYARKAALAAQRLGQIGIEALFRIDALAVTLRKIGRYKEAEQEIQSGLECLARQECQTKESTQLQALGYTFLAKVYVEQKNLEEASSLMAKATALESICSPALRHRIFVTAGDLAYEKKAYEEAERYYDQASKVANGYRTEGDTDLAGVYRKIGFCYLGLNNLDQAQTLFEEVIRYGGQGGELNDIYATFGMAHVMQRQGKISTARRRAKSAKKKLSQLSIEHPVLHEINDFLRKL